MMSGKGDFVRVGDLPEFRPSCSCAGLKVVDIFEVIHGFFSLFFLFFLFCSYRQCDPSEKHIYKASPLLGQLHKVKKSGVVHVGDVVYQITH